MQLSCLAPAWVSAGGLAEPQPLGYGGLSHLRRCTSMPCLAVWPPHARLAGGEGGVLPSLLKARSLAASGGCRRCALRRLVNAPPPPPGGAYSRRWGPITRLSRGGGGGGGCPGWPVAQQCLTPLPTAAQAAHCLCWCVSHIRSRSNRGRASRRIARGHLPSGVKRAGPDRSGIVRLLLHLVMWSLPGTLGQHRPRIKVHAVRFYAALCSSPRAALALSIRWRCTSCRLGLPLWLFPLPPRHPGLLLQGPALRVVLLHPSQVMPYRHRVREQRPPLDPHYCSRPQRDEGPAPGGDGHR